MREVEVVDDEACPGGMQGANQPGMEAPRPFEDAGLQAPGRFLVNGHNDEIGMRDKRASEDKSEVVTLEFQGLEEAAQENEPDQDGYGRATAPANDAPPRPPSQARLRNSRAGPVAVAPPSRPTSP